MREKKTRCPSAKCSSQRLLNIIANGEVYMTDRRHAAKYLVGRTLVYRGFGESEPVTVTKVKILFGADDVQITVRDSYEADFGFPRVFNAELFELEGPTR